MAIGISPLSFLNIMQPCYKKVAITVTIAVTVSVTISVTFIKGYCNTYYRRLVRFTRLNGSFTKARFSPAKRFLRVTNPLPLSF